MPRVWSSRSRRRSARPRSSNRGRAARPPAHRPRLVQENYLPPRAARADTAAQFAAAASRMAVARDSDTLEVWFEFETFPGCRVFFARGVGVCVAGGYPARERELAEPHF